MNTSYRDRILGHRTCKPEEVKPHPLNFRTHPADQKFALQAVLNQVGISRSVLGYIAEGDRNRGWQHDAVTLIDGHLRITSIRQPVRVEVLDVSDEEARVLLLSMDPMSALAGTDTEALDALRSVTTTADLSLKSLWDTIGQPAPLEVPEEPPAGPQGRPAAEEVPEQWLVIVHCSGEKHQTEVLGWCKSRGLKCKPVIS